MKKSAMKIRDMMSKLFAMLIAMVIVPAVSYCQPPDPTDGNPDVPFDDNMNIMFLIIGVTFAGIIVWQEMRRRRKLAGTDVKS